jgi:hypothetical protein
VAGAARMRAQLIVATCVLTGCVPANDAVTLYLSSSVTGVNRVHVATFDVDAGIAYNRDNCETARGLFQAQPGDRRGTRRVQMLLT